MGSWKDTKFRQLKKVVYALTEDSLEQLIKDHEKRGWVIASDVKPYGNGVGCLMKYGKVLLENN